MLRDEQISKAISDILGILSFSIENKGSIHFHDDKTACENFFMELFNIIYGYNLQNANHIKQNFPAIDLVDKSNDLCYQITCENSLAKIRETKDKFVSNGLDKEYSNLKIFIFGKKPKNRDDDSLVSYKENLLNDIYSLGLDKKKTVLSYLEENINLYRQEKKGLELLSIHVVIRYLSEQQSGVSNNNNFEDKPAPEEKLEHRFQKFKKIITEEYSDLYPNYHEVLKTAKDTLIDDGNSDIIKKYLRGRSRRLLSESENDAKQAFEKLIKDITSSIEEEIHETAARFYLLSELMECDIFPLSKSEKQSLRLSE